MADVFNFYVRDDRKIDFYSPEPIMQEDKDVAVWRFRIPKVLNQIDMTAWAWWFVYINSKGHQYSESLTLSDDVDEPDAFSVAEYSIDYGISKHPGSFTFALEAINADQGGEIAGEWHTYTYTHKVVGTLQGNQAEFAETESDIISALIVEVQNKVNSLVGGATPQVVSSVSDMTDTSKIYVLSTDGNWYWYNGSAWQSGGQYASGITIDSTLTQSGQAADAKVVGDKIGGIDDQLRDNHLAKRIVKNQYINANGNIKDYNGWDRTDYINVEGVYLLKVTAIEASNYNCFYNIDKELVRALNGQTGSNTINLTVGENIVIVPPDAKYVIFSGTANAISSLIIEPLKMRADMQINKHTHYIQTDLNGRQVVVFDVDDFEIGKRLDASGNDVSDTRSAITTDYYPIYNTQNKYKFECQGYKVVICQYIKNSDGTYTFVRASDDFIQNSGELWCSTGVTHVRIYFSTNNTATLSSVFVEGFCNSFVMRENRDINKYLRVCTFNQAANYPHFMNATEENLNKRIVNYLNFIGEYNPDVLCAQEAVATYFQPISYEKSTAAVFDRKYLYRYQPGYQRKTWSKYNYAHAEKIDFTAQAEGDARFYGKQTIYFEGKEIVILNTHCAYQGESDFETVRKKQFEQLRDEMAQHEYCILCGDFNAWSAEEFDVFSDYNMANCGEYGVIDTWYVGTEYVDWPFKAFDNIITTKNIVIQNVKRGPYDFDYFSDHAPLIADLQIR